MVNVLTDQEINTLRQVAHILEQRGLPEESAALWEVLAAGRRDEVRASTAARILHVTPQTVRNWVRRGTLDGRIDPTGHVYVQASSLAPAVEMDAAMPRRSAADPEITDDEIVAEVAAYRADCSGAN